MKINLWKNIQVMLSVSSSVFFGRKCGFCFTSFAKKFIGFIVIIQHITHHNKTYLLKRSVLSRTGRQGKDNIGTDFYQIGWRHFQTLIFIMPRACKIRLFFKGKNIFNLFQSLRRNHDVYIKNSIFSFSVWLHTCLFTYLLQIKW